MVVSVVRVAGGTLSQAEVVGAVAAAVEWGGLPPGVRHAALHRLGEPEFWGFGFRSGLWEIRGSDVVLPPDQYPFGNPVPPSQSRSTWSEGSRCPATDDRAERAFHITPFMFPVLFLVVSLALIGLAGRGAESRSDSAALVWDWGLLPRWTRLTFALDPELVDLAAVSPYGCAGLVGASASVVSVGVEQPLEVCGFSVSRGMWERVTDDAQMSVYSPGSGAVVFLGDGRVRAVAPGRADVTADYGGLFASLKLQVLP